jgi:hypothetical protein
MTRAEELQKSFPTDSKVSTQKLVEWKNMLNAMCDEYEAQFENSELRSIHFDTCFFYFDYNIERVVLAYGVSVETTEKRDAPYLRDDPGDAAQVIAALGADAFEADRGHFLSHAAGGPLHINIFPHRRELNRGWSAEGKRFRAMERHVADSPGTLYFHRPIYDDHRDIPLALEYGILGDGESWWIDRFQNKNAKS